jgi:hypothetical protein
MSAASPRTATHHAGQFSAPADVSHKQYEVANSGNLSEEEEETARGDTSLSEQLERRIEPTPTQFQGAARANGSTGCLRIWFPFCAATKSRSL